MNPLKKKPRTKNTTEIPVKPDWMKIRLRFSEEDSVSSVRQNLEKNKLHTVCESASCPNLHHCWSKKSATYMLGGDICTRKCAYCDVASGKPNPLNLDEPFQVAESALAMGLKYVVITSVNRDDLEDGGAEHFKNTVEQIKKLLPDCKVEVLIPDFKGKQSSLDILYSCKPDVINHNIETVPSLFKQLAPQKNYQTSLSVLRNISSHGFITKTGIILGLGESIEEVKSTFVELKDSGVSILTIGQYLQPTPTHYPIVEYIQPEVFIELKKYALELGFRYVESGPKVRSSYYAELSLNTL